MAAKNTLSRLLQAMELAPPLGSLGDESADLGLCIVAPAHPWLSGWLDDALGLTPGDAVRVTLPGGVARAESGGVDESVVRGIATAVFRFGCHEVLLLALPEAMSPPDSSGLIAGFRDRGISRDAIPSADLRGYLGLGESPRGWLPRAVADLRASETLPDDLLIHAGVIDPRKASLEILVTTRKGDSPARAAAPDPDPERSTFGGDTGPVPLARAMLTPLQLRPALEASHDRTMDAVGRVSTYVHPSTPGRSPHENSSPSPRAPSPSPRAPPSPRQRTPGPRRAPRPDERIDLDASEVTVRGHRLPPDLLQALRVVRSFYQANFELGDRLQMFSAASQALGSGLGVEVGLKVVIQPVIRLGPVRYQVLNELLAVKTALGEMPAPIASLLLRAILS